MTKANKHPAGKIMYVTSKKNMLPTLEDDRRLSLERKYAAMNLLFCHERLF